MELHDFHNVTRIPKKCVHHGSLDLQLNSLHELLSVEFSFSLGFLIDGAEEFSTVAGLCPESSVRSKMHLICFSVLFDIAEFF